MSTVATSGHTASIHSGNTSQMMLQKQTSPPPTKHTNMITSSKRAPVAYQSNNLFELGVGHVVIARFKTSGAAELGVFLVDVFCLGVKNAFFLKSDPGEFQEHLDKLFSRYAAIEISAACGRKLVESSVAYAARLGLPPHSDYKKACRVLGGIDARECETNFVFGQNGKPFYCQGPNDSPAFALRVMLNLEKKCGEGNFDYLLEVD